jgi:hypothetical protein
MATHMQIRLPETYRMEMQTFPPRLKPKFHRAPYVVRKVAPGGSTFLPGQGHENVWVRQSRLTAMAEMDR